MPHPIPIEPSGDDVRALTEEALQYLVEFTEGRQDAPSADFDGVDRLLERVRHRTTIRVCILSVHTHRDRIDELIGIVREAVQS
jgi:hypothetical protein